MPTAANHPIAIKIDQDTKDRIKRIAQARHRTSHGLMREAISQYLDREEKRETLKREGIKAWDAYQADGLHVSFKEADTWLGQLEAGHDVEPPECHV